MSNFPEAMFDHLLFMTKLLSRKVTYLNLKGFSRLLNKTYNSNCLLFHDKPCTNHILEKVLPAVHGISLKVGFRLPPLEPKKQNEKLDVLTADDFHLRSIGSR